MRLPESHVVSVDPLQISRGFVQTVQLHSECCPLMAQLSMRSGTGPKETAQGFEASMVILSLTQSFIVAIMAGESPDKKQS